MVRFGSAAILCGGKSSRMGFDKCLIKIKNKFLIEIIAEKLEEVFENIVFLSEGGDKFRDIKYGILEDIVPDLGPIGAIYTALKRSPSEYVFVTACDMPVVNVDFIKYMMEQIVEKKAEGVVCYRGGFLEPLYAFYSRNMADKFEKCINSGSLRLLDVIKSSNIHYIKEEEVRRYSGSCDIFTNLNYVSDLAALKKIFGEDI